LRWLSLLLLSAGLGSWSRQTLYTVGYRQSEISKGNIKLIQYSKNMNRQVNNILTGSRLRILRWLSLLLLSAGLVGWSRRITQNAWFRRPYLQPDCHKIFSLKNIKQILQTFQRTMEIQLKIMRWLSLLLLSEGLRWEPDNLAHFSWFRRP